MPDMDSLRTRAVELRKRGLTYSEINKALGGSLPKSTLSYWFRDIALTKEQSERINANSKNDLARARKLATQRNREIQATRLDKSASLAREFVGTVSQRDAKIALAMLYLGEGGKYPSTRGLYLGSSDPRIVNLYIQLLGICYGIKRQNLKCSIYHRADQDLFELTSFWSSELDIPRSNFYPSHPDPRTIDKPTKKSSYKGVAHIYHKGTDAQIELDHIADALLERTLTR